MLSQSDMDKIVLDAKKSLSDEQIKDAIKRCSYGGPITSKSQYKRPNCQGVTMDLKGGDTRYGKTNARTANKDKPIRKDPNGRR